MAQKVTLQGHNWEGTGGGHENVGVRYWRCSRIWRWPQLSSNSKFLKIFPGTHALGRRLNELLSKPKIRWFCWSSQIVPWWGDVRVVCQSPARPDCPLRRLHLLSQHHGPRRIYTQVYQPHHRWARHTHNGSAFIPRGSSLPLFLLMQTFSSVPPLLHNLKAYQKPWFLDLGRVESLL